MSWIILIKQGNNFGDLNVTFLNTKSHKKLESCFSEGEHSQVDYFLKALNKKERPKHEKNEKNQ